MGNMPMPGGTMSMMWTRMPGQWPGTATSFLIMWVPMMVLMMLPSLAPVLWRYCAVVRRSGQAHPVPLTAIVAAGYVVVWAAAGLSIIPIGRASTLLVHLSPFARVAPITTAAVMVIAGLLQHSRWKARHLAVCRAAQVRAYPLSGRVGDAWQYGLRMGLHCCASCAGPTAVMLTLGMMDMRVMAVATVGIAAERLAPDGAQVARSIGRLSIAGGVFVATVFAVLR